MTASPSLARHTLDLLRLGPCTTAELMSLTDASRKQVQRAIQNLNDQGHTVHGRRFTDCFGRRAQNVYELLWDAEEHVAYEWHWTPEGSMCGATAYRSCEWPGCRTRLSRTNHANLCRIHRRAAVASGVERIMAAVNGS